MRPEGEGGPRGQAGGLPALAAARRRGRAADAKVLVWLRDAGEGFGLPEEAVAAKLLGVLDAAPSGTAWRGDVSVLAGWAGAYEPPKEAACVACNGSGKFDCPTCGTCGLECGECDGGVVVEHVQRSGVLAGVPIDRNRLAKALAGVSGPCGVFVVDLSGQPCVRLAGEGWLAFVMSVLEAPGDAPVFGGGSTP